MNNIIKLFKIIFIFAITINIAASATFAPNGTNCSDYDYTVSTVQTTDYVATAMKANKDIEVTEVVVGSVAIFNFGGTGVPVFKVELVGDNAGKPTGTVFANLGTIADDDAVGTFTLPANVTIPSGTIFYLKLTPIVEEYNTNKYSFTAKECWCNTGNCNENGDLKLGSISDGSIDRIALLESPGQIETKSNRNKCILRKPNNYLFTCSFCSLWKRNFGSRRGM